ncbi:hypothetical protein DQ04_03201080 [Trypanosoma grayi]|uniref:hypothetical protein n=1 Tax=Trypanosoma grayi TaxID=71804 RepID=UPI0004F4A74A|nr:hypothetical protein DQ04_03201080 [Trypanosoma grayi]KEG10874.1 hypothetical protein DQ04_03201080 [Trypanosoma grayi]
METVVYEDIPDTAARVERLKVAMLAFAGVRAVAPAVTAILVPVDPTKAVSSLSSGASVSSRVREASEAKLRQACADRARLRTWLQRELGIAMDIWVVAAIEPRDAAALSTLANWQLDRHRSPLRQADALSLSLREVALLWGDHQQQAPMLTRFLLPHQSLFLDMTCCFGEGGRNLVDPVVFSPLRAKHVAKGRTCAVVYYNTWLPLTATPRGLARLQQQFRQLARHVLSPLQLPLCCAYGGLVETLQHSRVVVSFSITESKEEEKVEQEGNARATVSAALLATRSLKDIFSLAGFMLGHPQVNYYGEAKAFCASVQRRRRAAGFVYTACPVAVVAPKKATTCGTEAKRWVAQVSPAASGRKRGREETTTAAEAPAQCDATCGAEELSWCEDVGN